MPNRVLMVLSEAFVPDVITYPMPISAIYIGLPLLGPDNESNGGRRWGDYNPYRRNVVWKDIPCHAT